MGCRVQGVRGSEKGTRMCQSASPALSQGDGWHLVGGRIRRGVGSKCSKTRSREGIEIDETAREELPRGGDERLEFLLHVPPRAEAGMGRAQVEMVWCVGDSVPRFLYPTLAIPAARPRSRIWGGLHVPAGCGPYTG